MATYDVIVLGIGGMGSAACYHLARRGARVLGIEQFAGAHPWGSSHGKQRLIRRAYFEHPDYVPLINESYALWEALEAEAGRKLLHQTGLLLVGPESGGTVLAGCEKSAEIHKIPVEKITGDEIRRRYPHLTPPPGYRGVLEPGAGYLEVEACVEAYARAADAKGARLHFKERVERWTVHPTSVTVKTAQGSYQAGKLVIAAGPWTGPVLESLELPLTVRRAPQFWHHAEKGLSQEAGMPCFGFEMPYSFLYGFPSVDEDGVKMGDHTPREVVDNASSVDRSIHAEDGDNVRRCISECLTGVELNAHKSSVCLYTMTPDEHFIVDRHPTHSHVVFAGGFSGHGFKFASAIGRALSDLAFDGETKLPIDFLRMGKRFEKPAPVEKKPEGEADKQESEAGQ